MKPNDDLVKEIKRISEMKNHGETNLNLIAPVYAELLCLLSAEAEEQSRKNVELAQDTRNLTKGLFFFTKVLIALGAIQIIVSLFTFFYPFVHVTEHPTKQIMQTNTVVK
jgi:hypothetical protein